MYIIIGLFLAGQSHPGGCRTEKKNSPRCLLNEYYIVEIFSIYSVPLFHSFVSSIRYCNVQYARLIVETPRDCASGPPRPPHLLPARTSVFFLFFLSFCLVASSSSEALCSTPCHHPLAVFLSLSHNALLAFDESGLRCLFFRKRKGRGTD